MATKSTEKTRPPQHQSRQPGKETQMQPRPQYQRDDYRGSGKLRDKVAIITGGDSGIGRAIAIYFAREGADVAIVYLNEHKDAEDTRRLVEKEERRCLAISGDMSSEEFSRRLVKQVIAEFHHLDVLVNNAAVQFPQERIEDITAEQLERTFRTNIFAQFYLVKAALPYMKEGSSIINTASVTAYRGSPSLVDYSSTKGAIVAFTRSLSLQLADRKIRVNAVAPGPIWTPLITATFSEEKVETFGKDTPMQRPGEPAEVAPCYVFLASNDSSYISGQVLHPNGGEMVES